MDLDDDGEHVYSDIELSSEEEVEFELSDDELSDFDLGHHVPDESKPKNIKDFLNWWSVRYCVPRTHVSVLLKGLKQFVEVPYELDLNLPRDFRALLKTPRDVTSFITELDGGRFANLGVKRGLQRIVNQGADLSDVRDLKLLTFLDGFSPYKKTGGKKFWALLHKVELPGGAYSPVFMSGIYVGKENPDNFNNLLRNFVEEFNELKREPFTLEGVPKPVKLSFRCIVCDMPAKGDAKGVKYSGYGVCDMCEQRGHFVKSVVLSDLVYVLRTNEKFRSRVYGYGSYHKVDSVLEDIEEIDMVLDLPHDYLHLVLLGTTRRFMKIYVTKTGKHRISDEAREEAALLFKEVSSSMTAEFQWRPQNLLKSDLFKGKEYRYLLLYGGVIAFKDVLPEDDYKNFLNLSCAIRILASPEMAYDEDWLKRAENLLFNFVHFLKNKVGKEHCVRVVHGLLHLTEDVRRFGHLDKFSAFPFESFLASIKYLLRSPGGALT
jgi:hypothetical protein